MRKKVRGHRVFERQKGVRRAQVTYRPPKDVEVYLDALDEKGQPKMDVITRAIRLLRDVTAELGLEWWEIEKRAAANEVTAGTMLAKLAKDALAEAAPILTPRPGAKKK